MVRPAGGRRYVVGVRGHQIHVDQPAELGGTDTAPTPTELFVAGLASCVAFYAGSFLHRHGVPSEGLRVDVDWELSETRPARVEHIDVIVTPPTTLPAARWPALLAVARHCTVHNSLEQTPEVSVELVDDRVPRAV